MTRTGRFQGTDGALFQCRAPDAKEVFLAGTFNEWDPKATPMERTSDGTWCARLDLPAGRYEYSFIVDGRWCCDVGIDENGPQRVPNPFSTFNLVKEISQQ